MKRIYQGYQVSFFLEGNDETITVNFATLKRNDLIDILFISKSLYIKQYRCRPESQFSFFLILFLERYF